MALGPSNLIKMFTQASWCVQSSSEHMGQLHMLWALQGHSPSRLSSHPSELAQLLRHVSLLALLSEQHVSRHISTSHQMTAA